MVKELINVYSNSYIFDPTNLDRCESISTLNKDFMKTYNKMVGMDAYMGA